MHLTNDFILLVANGMSHNELQAEVKSIQTNIKKEHHDDDDDYMNIGEGVNYNNYYENEKNG